MEMIAIRAAEPLIEAIRERIDMVDLVGRYTSLRPSGSNYMGRCPFHEEKTPSFSVSREKQVYHCFGCGKSGNLFNFVMEIEHLAFPEAVAFLAELVGIDPTSYQTTQSSFSSRLQVLRAAVERAVALFAQRLSPVGEAYLRERGISPETAHAFQLGYADGRVGEVLLQEGIPADVLREIGLRLPSQHRDRFFDRLIFPIADAREKPVGWGARVIHSGHPKYLNSPENPLFRKRALLYGLPQARAAMLEKGEAVLLEGYMDVLQLWQAGVRHVVASLGTSLTREQALLLRRYVSQVIFCYDGDAAGAHGMQRAIATLEEAGLAVRVARLPGERDPDEFVRKFGSVAFERNILGKSVAGQQYLLETMAQQYDLSDPQGRAAYLTAAAAHLSKVENAIVREEYVRWLADKYHVSAGAIAREVEKQRKPADSAPSLTVPKAAKTKARTAIPPAVHEAEHIMVRLFLADRDLAEKYAEPFVQLAVTPQAARTAQQLRELCDAFQPWTPEALIQQLDPEEAAWTAESVMTAWEVTALERWAVDCLYRLDAYRFQQASTQLLEAIAQAEAAGELQRMATLQQQHLALERQRRGLRRKWQQFAAQSHPQNALQTQ